MTSITKIPAGTTHTLIESACDGPFYEFIKLDGEHCYSWWGHGWRQDCNTLQHMNLYIPVVDVVSIKEREDAENEDAEFNRVGVNNV